MTAETQQDAARPRVSIIIPTFNRLAELKKTVQALETQSLPADEIEIIVVDNSSSDGTREWAEQRAAETPERFRYLRKEPEGPSAARNAGLQIARGAFALLMDSDVVLDANWLAHALEYMERHPEVGCLGGQVLYAHDTERVNAFGGELSPIGLAWDHLEGEAVHGVPKERETLWINCSAMLLRTEVYTIVGGFDPVYFYGYEDSDFGWRVNLAGYNVVVLRELVVFHHVGTEIGESNPQIVFHYCKNRLRSLLKNYAFPRTALFGLAYLGYAVVDLVARAPREPKLRALLWNVRVLPDTLRLRRTVQQTRKVTDAALRPMFTRSWFPPTRLAGRRRRPVASGAEQAGVPSAVVRDDRVG